MMLRDIVEGSSIPAVIDAYINAIERLDDQWDSLKWLLSRTPQLGIPLNKETPELCVYKMQGLAGLPDLLVLYAYDDYTVILHSLLVMIDEEPAIREIQKAQA